MGYDKRNVPLRGRSTVNLFLSVLAFFAVNTVFIHAHVDISSGRRCNLGTDAFTNSLLLLNQHKVLADRRPTHLKESVSISQIPIRIHYTKTGSDAVDPVDSNLNGIPDYIDSLIQAVETTWERQIYDMGYKKPINSVFGDSTTPLDIYVRDLALLDYGYYGRTMVDSLIAGSPHPRYVCFIEIDNNFSPSDTNIFGVLLYNATGTDAAKVTVAHELHHAIQISAYGATSMQVSFYELTSTWMEHAIFPNVGDLDQYARSLLLDPTRYPFSSGDAQSGYRWGWFGNVLNTVNGPATLRSMWDSIATGYTPHQSVRIALLADGVELRNLFCNNALPIMYRTSYRAAEMDTLIPRASAMPSIAFSADESLSDAGTMITGQMAAFEVRAARLTFRDVVSATPKIIGLLWSPANESYYTQGSTRRTDFTIIVNKQGGSKSRPLTGTPFFVQVIPDDICLHIEGVAPPQPESAYPQPWRLSSGDDLRIPISNLSVGDIARVYIYSPDGVILKSIESRVEVERDSVVVRVPPPDRLTAGVYLLSIGELPSAAPLKIVIK